MVQLSKEITILIPAFNEEKSIANVVNDVYQVMKETTYDYEILVVDDCSQDRTLIRIPDVPHIRVVCRNNRGGSGGARKTGIQAAYGKIIVMLDGDDSYDAQDIPSLLRWFPHYDQVNGVRTTEKGRLTWMRTPVKWMIRKVAEMMTMQKIPDLNTGLKAFKRDIMMEYLDIIPNGFSCVSTMSLAFLTNGYRVKYIPTKYYERIGKSKFHIVKDTYRYMRTVYKIIRYFGEQHKL